jgi:hypothetical protein
MSATGERRQPTNAYSLFILQSVNATGCLAWQERSLDVQRRKKKCSDRINVKEEVYNPEHLYRLVGVRSEQVTSGELQLLIGMSCCSERDSGN